LTSRSSPNRLLARLPRAERERLLAHATEVPLAFGEVLVEPGQDHGAVWFPLTGFVSVVARVEGQAPLEMGLIGREGMLGATVVLGVDTVPLGGLVQGDGSALRINLRPFRRCLKQSPVLQRSLQRYLYVVLSQLAQSAVCTRFHEVNQRLARWLLMTHDRTAGDRLHLTHQFLAGMLGVRRSAVTIAAGHLQDRGIIHYNRGEIDVLDRPALEAWSCECYAAVVQDYDDLLG
jgi:CRP-like cAMP-binding protein